MPRMETSLEETLERNYSDYLNLQTTDTVVNRDFYHVYILLTRTTMKRDYQVVRACEHWRNFGGKTW